MDGRIVTMVGGQTIELAAMGELEFTLTVNTAAMGMAAFMKTGKQKIKTQEGVRLWSQNKQHYVENNYSRLKCGFL